MEIKHIHPHYENNEIKEKTLEEILYKLYREIVIDRNKNRKCKE